MILERLDNAAKYTGLRPGISEAFGFLDQPGLENLPDGKYEISGDRVYAIITRTNGRKVDEGELEAHRKYIDIQYTLTGTDFIGWDEASRCTPDNRGYNPEKDIVYYSDRPELWITVPAGHFAVFFSHDAHAPLGTDADIHKIVVKVAEDWKV